MKAKIRLDTITDIANFVLIVETNTTRDERVYVTDGDRMCVNAKSFLGLVHAREFTHIYVESDKDLYSKLKDYIIEN